MPYKVYTDKDEDFVCEVSVKNASLKDSIARIILEANGISLVYEGYIKNGKCIIPIKRVRGLLDEHASGKMHLELIVDNMYFKPWKSDFSVEEHTTVKVQVDENGENGKPSVSVKGPVEEIRVKYDATGDIIKICEQFDINRKTIPFRKKDFKLIVAEYFKNSPEVSNKKKEILHELGSFFK